MPYPSDMDAAEAELQQELREMFAVDTQQQLETFFNTIERLNEGSWQQDIPEIYRAIHTIKGGAVTVAADAMLHTAIVLEDLLSDLRYLEQAPPLADGLLRSILLEAGELLSSSMEITESGAIAIDLVQPTVQRLTELRESIDRLYLSEWDESRQLHQEFAEQGFELVILQLEMALAQLPLGIVPAPTIEIARATIAQLTQIGSDIELADGWELVLESCLQLIAKPDSQLWRSLWFEYFQILKVCVKNSGQLTSIEIDKLDALLQESSSNVIDLNFDANLIGSDLELDFDATLVQADIDATSESLNLQNGELPDLLDRFFEDEAIDFEPLDDLATLEQETLTPVTSEFDDSIDDLPDLLDDFFLDTDLDLLPLDRSEICADNLAHELATDVSIDLTDLTDLLDNFFVEAEEPPLAATLAEQLPEDGLNIEIASTESDRAERDIRNLFDDLFSETDIESSANISQPTEVAEDEIAPISIDPSDTIVVESISDTPQSPEIAKRSIQIPVSLKRLDKSAQQVVDTLLTARAVMNVSNQLQAQLNQLTSLTQESAQYVTRLRQLQDDYALLRNLSDDRDSGSNVTLERYRQGYTTINRLLENILRMSELGQEIETATYQSSNRLEALDRSILRLKDGIETSRLMPFRNLTQRAKAILRDLTNRYGKPAELIVQNERFELDAGIVQQLEPALLHLLRNAYDHGLEPAQQRVAAGKPAQGQIKVSIERLGNRYRLIVADDGGGIDPTRIAEIARSKGFPFQQTTTNAELLAVLCQPGFSSSSAVSEVSGRGVGMDVVVTQIASIGGSLTLDTQRGRGTTFSIEVPAPQLLVPCILVRVGERIVALPSDEVLQTTLLSSMAPQFTRTHDLDLCNWTLTTSESQVAGYDLDNYWQPARVGADKLVQRAFPETAICIRTRQADGTPEIWSIADDLIGQSELLINPLPQPLIAPVGLLGVSLQSDGRLISILDPIALTIAIATAPTRSQSANSATVAAQTPAIGGAAYDEHRSKSTAPTILVVDDAAMMRRRFEASLNNHGFIVHTCNDGLEALNWLQNHPQPGLMITDVEMPNMDGFTLIDRCRQADIEIPILVVSSRLSEEWGKEARRLGATDYLNKGFSTAELLQKVNSLLELYFKRS